MNIYVKLGFGWSFMCESKFAFLTNLLLGKTYQIESCYIDIIKDIRNVVSLADLRYRYGDLWDVFQKELETANAIFYDSTEEKYRETVNIGGRLMQNSRFVHLPPQIVRLTLQINERCGLTCEECGADTQFPCMSCATSPMNRTISLERAINVIQFSTNFGLTELHIVGGDPLLDFSILFRLVNEFRKRNKNGKVWVYTNGVELPKLDSEQIAFLKSNTCIALVINTQNISLLFQLVEKLKEFEVPYEIQTRNIDSNILRSSFSNDTLTYRTERKLPVVTTNNLIRQNNIYSNSINGIKQHCLDGRAFLSIDGQVGVCKHYLIAHSQEEIFGAEICDKIDELRYLDEESLITDCKICGVESLCFSCVYLRRRNSISQCSGRGEFCQIRKENVL